MAQNILLTNSLLFGSVFDSLEEVSFIYLVIGMFGFALILNTIRYVVHKIKYANYNRNRTELYKKQKKKCKIEKIVKILNKNENFNKLPSRYKKRLEEYVKFLIKDMKYNVYCQNFSFTTHKNVDVKISMRNSLGTFYGKPKKVFLKIRKASKRYSGLLDALQLFEEIAYRRKLNGLYNKTTEIKFNYTLSWTEYR